MIELIAIIILSGSIFGILVISIRKIPALKTLPETGSKGFLPAFLFGLKGKIQNIPFLKSSSLEMFLQKVLSKIRVLTLKVENRIACWLQNLRQRSQRKKEPDNYWDELKKNQKSPPKADAPRAQKIKIYL